jgi:hypothetical protein
MSQPTAWKMRYATIDFFLFLNKIGLSKQGIAQSVVANFVRRHKSRYDLAPASPAMDWRW